MKEYKKKPWVGKTYKKPYTGIKRFDKGCRNHGSCKWCQDNRLHKSRYK